MESRSDGAVRAYVDDYTSTKVRRPALDAAFDYLGTVGFDVIVVYSLDRLARDSYVRQTIERNLAAMGAQVEYVLGDFEDSPEGEVRKDLEATFAKWENAKRVERCNRGKRRKAEEGLFVSGRAPFGYTIDKTAPGGLAVNEGQAEVVRHIFQLYVQAGKSVRGIAKQLTQEGAVTHSGKTQWSKSTVHRILSNTAYVGRAYYNKHAREGGKLVKRPLDEWIEFRTTPLVADHMFNEAQRRLECNRRTRRRQPKRFYLLGGMVFCSDCERPYHAQTHLAGTQRRKNDAQTYRHRTSAGHCHNQEISGRLLEPVVWREVKKVLLDPQRLLCGYEESRKQHLRDSERHRQRIRTLDGRLARLRKARSKLTSTYIDPEIRLKKTEYIEQKDRLDTDIEAVQREIERLDDLLGSIPTPADLETLESFTNQIRTVLTDTPELTEETKREILAAIHLRVFVKPDGALRIEGWFGKAAEGLSYITC
jgi:site-specific DNA recombinase